MTTLQALQGLAAAALPERLFHPRAPATRGEGRPHHRFHRRFRAGAAAGAAAAGAAAARGVAVGAPVGRGGLRASLSRESGGRVRPRPPRPPRAGSGCLGGGSGGGCEASRAGGAEGQCRRRGRWWWVRRRLGRLPTRTAVHARSQPDERQLEPPHTGRARGAGRGRRRRCVVGAAAEMKCPRASAAVFLDFVVQARSQCRCGLC